MGSKWEKPLEGVKNSVRSNSIRRLGLILILCLLPLGPLSCTKKKKNPQTIGTQAPPAQPPSPPPTTPPQEVVQPPPAPPAETVVEEPKGAMSSRIDQLMQRLRDRQGGASGSTPWGRPEGNENGNSNNSETENQLGSADSELRRRAAEVLTYKLKPSEMNVPIYTGAVNVPGGQQFTDGRSDLVMSRLTAMMDDQKNFEGEDFDRESLELAKSLDNVDVDVNLSAGTVAAYFVFKQENREVRIDFGGNLQGSQRQAVLAQSTKTSYEDGSFRGYVTCIDAKQDDCKQTVIVIEQLRDAIVCKRIFVVHRWGDARFDLADEDYLNFNAFPNPYHKYFTANFANTAHANRYLLTCTDPLHNGDLDHGLPLEERRAKGMLITEDNDGTCAQLQSLSGPGGFHGRKPYFRVLGLRSWAAAYGASFFNIFTREYKAANNDPYDVLHIYGPLLTSANVPADNRPLRIDGYRTTQLNQRIYGNRDTLSAYIQRATLVRNDGMGRITVAFDFAGSPAASSVIQFSETLGDIQDPNDFELFPEENRQRGPEPLADETLPAEGGGNGLPGATPAAAETEEVGSRESVAAGNGLPAPQGPPAPPAASTDAAVLPIAEQLEWNPED